MAYKKTTWANDERPFIDAMHLNNMEKGIMNAVCKNGDTMIGSLILNSEEPVEDNEAVTRNYVQKYVRETVPTYKLLNMIPLFR